MTHSSGKCIRDGSRSFPDLEHTAQNDGNHLPRPDCPQPLSISQDFWSIAQKNKGSQADRTI
jgi:hypothetical protein